MENNTFGSLQNNLGAKIQKIKKCAGLGMIWQSEFQYQDVRVLLLPLGEGVGVVNKGFLEVVTTYNHEQLRYEQQNWRSRLW